MARFTSYPNKAKPADSDTLLINDAGSSSNKQVSFTAVLGWVKDKLGSSTIDGLDTTSKNVVGAINELHNEVGGKADSSSVYTKSQVDALIESVDVETDTTLSVSGKPADAKKTGDEISAIKADLEDLDDRVEALEGGSGGGLTEGVKTALMNLVNHVTWDDDDPTGQTYITALYDALYPPADLVSISAVYTQSGTVYDANTLDSLKSDLVVTAHMSNSTTQTVTNYTLSGTLAEGTSTITVTYGGKTTTFTVDVTSIMEDVPITWTGSGADKTSSMIDATNADVYWTFPYIEGFSGYSSDTTRESGFIKLQAYLYSDSEGTTPVGRYHIDNEIIETTGRTTAKRPWMPVDAQVKVAPHGYYVKLMASKSGTGFSSNANCETFLNTYANTVKLMATSGG